MEVKNFGSQQYSDYAAEVERGGRFVVFQFCVSIIAYTYRANSSIYLIRSGESGMKYIIPYNVITLIAGWWGIPWGPMYTVQSLYNNLKGGVNVTGDVLSFKSKQLNPRNQYF